LLDFPKETQETRNGRNEEHSNLSKRASTGVDGDAPNARSTRQKTGENSGAILEKTAIRRFSLPASRFIAKEDRLVQA